MAEVFLLFLRFGLTGFGGPLAHTALFEEECVHRRRWLSRENFLEKMSLTQLIPGPNSTELAMQLGYVRAGWAGFFLAGLAFLLPASVMVAVLGALYVQAGGFPGIGRWVWGTKPAVAALILVMLFRTGKATLRPWQALPPALFGFLLVLLGASVWSGLMAAAGASLLFRNRDFPRACVAFLLALPPYFPLSLGQASLGDPPTVHALFTEMLKLGSLVFGSGYVLFSYFSAQLVERLHWFDNSGLAMAIAAGQLTPGPLFSSAVFFGQVLQGVPGAIACGAGIFAPAFFFCALSIPLARRLEGSPWWKDSLKVLGALCLLLLARESWRMFPLFLDGWAAYGIFAVALLAHTRFRVNSAWLVAAGALAGGFLH